MRFPADDSVHLQAFFGDARRMAIPALIEKWNRIRALRRVVTGALEIERRDKIIGASLEAAPVLYVSDAADAAILNGIDFAEIAITSAAHVVTREPPPEAFTPAGSAGRGRTLPSCRGRQMRALLDDPAGSGQESVRIPTSATAAPGRWTPCGGRMKRRAISDCWPRPRP